MGERAGGEVTLRLWRGFYSRFEPHTSITAVEVHTHTHTHVKYLNLVFRMFFLVFFFRN